MRYATFLSTLLCVLALTTSPVSAQEPRLEQVTAERSGVFSLEAAFDFGFVDQLKFTDTSEDEPRSTNVDASPTFGFTSAVEFKLSDVVGLGLEIATLWIIPEDRDIQDARRILVNPMARARFSYPVYNKLNAELFGGLGASIWLANDEEQDAIDSSRFGLALRFGVGAAYELTPWLSAYSRMGYVTALSFGDDITARFGTFTASLGLRVGI